VTLLEFAFSVTHFSHGYNAMISYINQD